MKVLLFVSLLFTSCITVRPNEIPKVAKMECLENLVRFKVAGEMVTAMDDKGNGIGCKIQLDNPKKATKPKVKKK